jgi:ATP-binding cassette subfamily F protein 3
LEKLHQAQANLETQLADPALYEAANKDRLQTLLLDKAKLGRDVEEAELTWLDAVEALENADVSEN